MSPFIPATLMPESRDFQSKSEARRLVPNAGQSGPWPVFERPINKNEFYIFKGLLKNKNKN